MDNPIGAGDTDGNLVGGGDDTGDLVLDHIMFKDADHAFTPYQIFYGDYTITDSKGNKKITKLSDHAGITVSVTD